MACNVKNKFVLKSRDCRCAILDYVERVVNLTPSCHDDCLMEAKCELMQIFSGTFLVSVIDQTKTLT